MNKIERIKQWSQEGLHWVIIVAGLYAAVVLVLATAAIIWSLLNEPIVWTGIAAVLIALCLNDVRFSLFESNKK